jgi:hypothetical protein
MLIQSRNFPHDHFVTASFASPQNALRNLVFVRPNAFIADRLSRGKGAFSAYSHPCSRYEISSGKARFWRSLYFLDRPLPAGHQRQ